MISVLWRENSILTRSQILNTLDATADQEDVILKRLKAIGVLKPIRSNNTVVTERDSEFYSTIDTTSKMIVGFVGVAVVLGRVIKCFPKYVSDADDAVRHLRQALRVLEKLNASASSLKNAVPDLNGTLSDSLRTYLFLLRDYFEFGSYTRTHEFLEHNGMGEINWDWTINSSYPIISDSRPYYVDLITRKVLDDDSNYFKQLHESILTQVSSELTYAGISELFDLPRVQLSDQPISSFGDNEEILYKVENELNEQFDTRKRAVLTAIYSFLSNHQAIESDESDLFYGTGDFAHVWEVACKKVYGDQLNSQLDAMTLPSPLRENYSGKTLLNIIEKPYWSYVDHDAAKTLEPDVIVSRQTQGKWRFVILDAKYYTPRFDENNTPKGVPGVESVTKQYLYQLAYKEFLKQHRFTGFSNCFIIPSDTCEVQDFGTVAMKMLNRVGLADIDIRMVPAFRVFDSFLLGETLNIDTLQLTTTPVQVDLALSGNDLQSHIVLNSASQKTMRERLGMWLVNRRENSAPSATGDSAV